MLNCIEKRQSIRRYKDVPVSMEQIETILKSAMNAPSARNEQCWKFLVVRNREILDEIANTQQYMKMMKTAPCAIVVLADKTKVSRTEYMYYDCSAAIENMLLEAVNLNLSTCWCAIGPTEERVDKFVELFNLDESTFPISIVSLGVSDEEKDVIDRYDPSKVQYID